MKILIATFTYSPALDGVAMASSTLAGILSHAGHEIVIATEGESDTVPRLDTGSGALIYEFDISGTLASREGYQGDTERFRDFLRQCRPDIVFFQCWHHWYVDLAMPMKNDIGFKTVMISHGYIHHMIERPWNPPFGIRRWLKRRRIVNDLPRQMRELDHMVFLSGKGDYKRFFDVRLAKKLGIKNISVIPNAVSTTQAVDGDSFRKKYDLENKTLFLYPANYCIRKNQDLALRVFAASATPNSCLVFVGSRLGSYGSMLKKSWDKLKGATIGLDVRFLEGIPRQEILDAFNACDAVLLTAHAETQPIVLLEAMAFGKPFISKNVGCVGDLHGGMIADSFKGLSRAVREFCVDPSLRHKLGQLGLMQYDRDFAYDKVRAQWLHLIDNLQDPSAGNRKSEK